MLIRMRQITKTLVSIATLVAAIGSFSGCVSPKAGAAVGEIVLEKIATEFVGPVFELSFTTAGFRQAHNRWPTNYTELCAYSLSACGVALTNYDRVDFTPTDDGKLKILALAKGVTNQMTLSPPEESRK